MTDQTAIDQIGKIIDPTAWDEETLLSFHVREERQNEAAEKAEAILANLASGYAGRPMSDADLMRHYEASKRDDAPPLVGSEVRQVIGELRHYRGLAPRQRDQQAEGER